MFQCKEQLQENALYVLVYRISRKVHSTPLGCFVFLETQGLRSKDCSNILASLLVFCYPFFGSFFSFLTALSSAAPLVPSLPFPDSRIRIFTYISPSLRGRLQRIVRWIDFRASCNSFVRIYALIKSRKFLPKIRSRSLSEIDN